MILISFQRVDLACKINYLNFSSVGFLEEEEGIDSYQYERLVALGHKYKGTHQNEKCIVKINDEAIEIKNENNCICKAFLEDLLNGKCLEQLFLLTKLAVPVYLLNQLIVEKYKIKPVLDDGGVEQDGLPLKFYAITDKIFYKINRELDNYLINLESLGIKTEGVGLN